MRPRRARPPPKARLPPRASARVPIRTTTMNLLLRRRRASTPRMRSFPSTLHSLLHRPPLREPSSSPSAPSLPTHSGASLISVLADPFSLLPSFPAPSPKRLSPTTSSFAHSSSTPPSGRDTSIAEPLDSRRASVRRRTMISPLLLGKGERSVGRRRKPRRGVSGKRGPEESS